MDHFLFENSELFDKGEVKYLPENTILSSVYEHIINCGGTETPALSTTSQKYSNVIFWFSEM